MDEYINRREFLEHMQGTSRYFTVKFDIENFPAADVAPARHGRWMFGKDLPENWGQLFKNRYHLYCSECKEQAHNKSEDNNPDFDIDTPYCPWCGAIMDLE